jgi:23S rRNA (cytidine1920-2'-O)/16S rRNA (cytidine1409-2'-O)-methyltransferase
MVASGLVLVAGAPADKVARLVAAEEPLTVNGAPARFVSRGGYKLEAALEHFGVEVEGKSVLDAGASTGGFTDCLLQAGASRVVAVDVGRAQLHEKLLRDERVEARERTDIRDVSGQLFQVVVADLSFISLRLVGAKLVSLTEPGGDLVVLVKPQFEAGRAEASRGKGVIRDPAVRERVVGEVIDAFASAGATNMGVMASPIRGADGNVEFLAHFRAPASGE